LNKDPYFLSSSTWNHNVFLCSTHYLSPSLIKSNFPRQRL
jgi:hypothetical protein